MSETTTAVSRVILARYAWGAFASVNVGRSYVVTFGRADAVRLRTALEAVAAGEVPAADVLTEWDHGVETWALETDPDGLALRCLRGERLGRRCVIAARHVPAWLAAAPSVLEFAAPPTSTKHMRRSLVHLVLAKAGTSTRVVAAFSNPRKASDERDALALEDGRRTDIHFRTEFEVVSMEVR